MKSFNLIFLLAPLFLSSLVQSDDPLVTACLSLDSFINRCNVLTPGFTSFTNFYFQAPCLCYVNAVWNPNIYDNLLSSCYAGYKTWDPSAYASATVSNGGDFITTPCHRVGNILSSPSATGTQTILSLTIKSGSLDPLITPTPQVTVTQNYDPFRSACAILDGAQAYCESKSPGFSSFSEFRSRAPCLCYSGFVYYPSYYDSLWGSCLKYLSTAAPSVITRVSSLGQPVATSTPCAAVGDVLNIRSGTTTAAARTASSGFSMATPTQSTSTFIAAGGVVTIEKRYIWLVIVPMAAFI